MTALRYHAVVVEDDPQIRRFLRTVLPAEGFEVFEAETGERGLVEAATRKPDVVILDLGLPDVDGAEVIRRLREWSQVPILVLSARTREQDKIAALDAGADDYLVKPFGAGELMARLRVALRHAAARAGGAAEPTRLVVGDLTLDLLSRRVERANQPLDLRPREFALLEYLLRHPGQVVSREMLARDVWKELSRGTPLDNVIDVNVARLRKKVDHGFPVKLLQTVRGVGFVIREGRP